MSDPSGTYEIVIVKSGWLGYDWTLKYLRPGNYFPPIAGSRRGWAIWDTVARGWSLSADAAEKAARSRIPTTLSVRP